MLKPRVYRHEEMITVAQFAKAIGMSRRFAYNLVERGQREGGVLAFRYGDKRGYRIPMSEVERYKKEKKIDIY